MLPDERIKEVLELLRSGRYSQREISRRTGVSRVVIYRIASGRRVLKPRPETPVWDEDRYKRPFERCPVCGGMVQLPCIACIVKRLKDEKTYRYDPAESLNLALEEEHHKRYIKVKAWRERQDDPNFATVPEDWPFRRKPHFNACVLAAQRETRQT